MADTSDLSSHLAPDPGLCSDLALRHARDRSQSSPPTAAGATVGGCTAPTCHQFGTGSHSVGRDGVAAVTGELQAIASDTADATARILDGCELLERHAAAAGCEHIVQPVTMRIYEACSFQDISAQRMAKIVRLLGQFGDLRMGSLSHYGPPSAASLDQVVSQLLNGPARPNEGLDQASVDALLGTSP